MNFDILPMIISLDLGLRQPRLEGDEYLSIVDEFMEAAFARWPKAVVQVQVLIKGYILCAIFNYRLLHDKNVNLSV